MTEPDHGSDPGSMVTRAEKVPGGFSLTGAKTWITGAAGSRAIQVVQQGGRSPRQRRDGVQIERLVSIGDHGDSGGRALASTTTSSIS